MPTMIPPTLPDGATSAKRTVFEEFQSSDLADGWVVLHSVKIPAARRRQRPSEVDFIVLIPSCGAICLEVKGGVYSADDVQAYADEGMESPRSLALMEAERRMFEVRAHLDRRSVPAVPVGCAVAFTETDWGEDYRDGLLNYPVYDRGTFSETSQLCASLAEYARSLKEDKPTREAMDRVRRELFPGSDSRYALAAGVTPDGHVDELLLRLTEEQYHNLELAEFNDRCLIEGGAGTGKTLLALELARRQVERDRRVLLLCGTRRQMAWLASLAPPGVEVHSRDTFLGWLMGSLADSAGSRAAAQFEEYTKQYASRFSNADVVDLDDEIELQIPHALQATEGSKLDLFDYLIVDEVQEFIQSLYWNVVDRSLVGGLADGKWAMFGHVYQNSAHLSEEADRGTRVLTAPEIVRSFGSYWSRGILTINCRNTGPIAEATGRFAVDSIGSRVLPSQVSGPSVDCYYIKNTTELETALNSAMVDLLKSYSSDQIIVIADPSLDDLRDAGVNTRRRYGAWHLKETRADGGPVDNGLEYCRAVNFLGMERDAVVFIALTNGSVPSVRMDDLSIVYIAMSRAKQRLIVLADADLPDFIKERLPKQDRYLV